MLSRAGFSPTKHLGHLERMQKKQGADTIKLGAVSGHLYKEILTSRAFDEFYFQIPPKKRWGSGEHERRVNGDVLS